MPINKYVLKIADSRKAVKIDEGMHFYAVMDNWSGVREDSSTTSWCKGEGNHEWEEKTYTFTELEKIKVKLHLNTPHYEENVEDRKIDRPMRGKETLEIIITKKRGGALGIQEIKNTFDRIEKTTGIWKIKDLIEF